MKKTKKEKQPKRQKVTFTHENTNATAVKLAGDFNDWDLNKHPMKDSGNGKWIKAVMLFPGKYEYKFLVDEEWQNDQSNNYVQPNCFGTYNNVINLSAK